ILFPGAELGARESGANAIDLGGLADAEIRAAIVGGGDGLLRTPKQLAQCRRRALAAPDLWNRLRDAQKLVRVAALVRALLALDPGCVGAIVVDAREPSDELFSAGVLLGAAHAEQGAAESGRKVHRVGREHAKPGERETLRNHRRPREHIEHP